MNKDYKNKTYSDAGVQKGFMTKALISILALILAFALTLTSCGTASGASSSAVTTTSSEQSADNAVSKSEMFTERDLSDEYDESEAETITLNGSSAETSAASGVSIDGSTVTISAEGVYIVSGTLSDGQIVVEADDAAKVQIVLKDASITSSTSAALYVKSADKVFVTTAEGTENTLANGGSFTADGDTNIDGAVYAKDDITFNGSGSLTITSPAGHGVVGNDDVKFGGGTYTITASAHGIKANDSARFAESDVTITAGADKDGVHVSDNDDASAAESDSFFYIADGTLTISAQDDGIHADAQVIIEGGTITVNESYEGIEGLSINISGGSTTVTATDDGLNAAGGNSTSGSQAFGGDDWNGGGMMSDGGTDGSITISGGSVKITAGGDGVDSNGSVEISGGYTVVQGPTNGDTSVLDYNGTATVKAGTFIATGGAGMAQSFSSADQGLIAVSVGNQSSGSTVTLKDESGAVIAETTPELDYAVVYISTEDMAAGSTYTLTAGNYSESITLSENIYSNLAGGMGGMGAGLGGGGPRGGMNGQQRNSGQQGGMPEGGMQQGGPGGMNGGHGGGRPQGGPEAGSGTDSVTGATQMAGGNAA